MPVEQDIVVEGFKVLEYRLNQLERKLAVSTLRKAMRRAVKPVLAQMKAAAPRGDETHKSYKGKLLLPGNLKESIKVVIQVDRREGSISARLGTKKEAFYGINFIDRGPITVTQRRVSVRGAFRHGRGVRTTKQIKPYTLPYRPWLVDTFVRNRDRMLNSLKTELAEEIRKVAHSVS